MSLCSCSGTCFGQPLQSACSRASPAIHMPVSNRSPLQSRSFERDLTLDAHTPDLPRRRIASELMRCRHLKMRPTCSLYRRDTFASPLTVFLVSRRTISKTVDSRGHLNTLCCVQGQLQEPYSQAHLKAGGRWWHRDELILCTVHVNAVSL